MKRLVIFCIIGLFSLLPVQAQDAMSLYELGMTTYWHGGIEAEAAELFTQAIDLDSEYVEAYAYRGAAYRTLNEMELAKADFDRALELNPESGLAISMLARWYAQRGELELALETNHNAITLAPELAVVHYNHGRILTDMEDYWGALSAYGEAINLEVNPVLLSQYYRTRGQTHIRAAEDRWAAVEDFTAAIETNPDNPFPYADRAHNYILFGQPGMAIPDLETALELDPDFVYALEQYGAALSEVGRYDESFAALEAAAELEPDRASLYLLQGLNYARMGDAIAAIEKMDYAEGLDPTRAYYYRQRAKAYQWLGQLDKAQEDFDQFDALGGHG